MWWLHQIQPLQNLSHKALGRPISPYHPRRRGDPRSGDEYCSAASDQTIKEEISAA